MFVPVGTLLLAFFVLLFYIHVSLSTSLITEPIKYMEAILHCKIILAVSYKQMVGRRRRRQKLITKKLRTKTNRNRIKNFFSFVTLPSSGFRKHAKALFH